MTLTIAPTRDYFLEDGRPSFYLADTVWMTFTHATMEEWREYLAYRRRQRFNAVQISVLPILHDMSASTLSFAPFESDGQGRWDYRRPSREYFDRAAAMLGAAREAGFTPVLMLLWCNYVPNTWASKGAPERVMPLDAVPGYVERVVDAFARYDPIFAISGDTDLQTPETIAHYAAALRAVKKSCPTALTTLHLAPQADWPDEFVRSPELDFYMYQSGHHVEEQSRAYTLAERFAGKPVRRPVVNGEPCYEGHGHGHRYGRFGAFDVRKAIWQSLLSGAGAGVTYGAHGMWSWHRRGLSFSSEAFSMRPFDWREALRLEGAWDASFARAIVEQYNLFGLRGRTDLHDASPEIRVAASADLDRVAAYVPYPTEVVLDLAPQGYRWTTVDLAARRWTGAGVAGDGTRTRIPMHEANSDLLAIGVCE